MTEFRSGKAKLIRELRQKAVAFVTGGGNLILAETKVRTPVDTGNLRASEQTLAFTEHGLPTSETGPSAEYAEYVEYGTSRQQAQPYAEPGFQAARPKIDILAGKVLKL